MYIPSTSYYFITTSSGSNILKYNYNLKRGEEKTPRTQARDENLRDRKKG
jgi:hypothetical protein